MGSMLPQFIGLIILIFILLFIGMYLTYKEEQKTEEDEYDMFDWMDE
jgi:type II secretory pathway component PulF